MHNEGCFWPSSGIPARMRCDPATATWQVIASCAAGQTCAEWADPGAPASKKLTGCQTAGMVDGVGTDGIGGIDAGVADSPGSSADSGLTPDTVAPDTSTPDTTIPDTSAPDTTTPDTIAPDVVDGGGTTKTIAQINQLRGAKSCSAGDTVKVISDVTLSGVAVLSPPDPNGR